jgi:6,7-dimethyl-8-ribityllumazine synthase
LVTDYGLDKERDIEVETVPGSFELPLACQSILTRRPEEVRAVIAIGVLVKGETMQ